MGFLANAFGIGSSGENWVAEKAKLDETMTPEQVQQAMAQHNASIQGQGQLAQQLAAQGGMGKQNDVYGQQQGLVGQQQGILGQQQGLAEQLAQMSQGGGPNPALAQLQQATGQNVAQQAALMGSARGGSANAGLMARQAAQQGSNIQQQAVGQGATMQAQQQLGAINALGQQQQAMGNTSTMIGNTMGQMGGMANQQVANQLAGTGALTNATANNQAQITGGLQQQNAQRLQNIQQANSAQAGIEQVAAKGEQDTRSGIFSALGKAIALSEGGEVPQTVISPFAQSSGGGGGGGGPDIGQIMKLAAVAMADGGKVPMQYSGGSQQDRQSRGQQAQSGVMKAAQDNPISKAMAWLSKSEGGPIPGQANVHGDSYSNDTVPTMLSPGEIVVPRSKASDPDKASEFVRNVIDKKPNSYKGFEKVNSTDHATTLRNQAGHQIMIAHGALSPEHREMIDALPHYADGGGVGLFDQIAQSQVQGGGSPTSMAGGMEGSRSPEGNVVGQMNAQLDARDAADDLARQQSQPQQQSGMKKVSYEIPMEVAPALPDTYGAPLQQAQQGIDQEAQAQAGLAQQKEKIAKDQINFATVQKDNYDRESKALNKERETLMSDYKSQKVDPNHFWESKTTGQKVQNTIGLLLSGFGGMQSVKMFSDMMDKQIENDISAQKDAIGQKKSLLDENMRKFGDLKTAKDATRVMQADIVAAQLDRAIAQASSPMAKAKATQAKAELMMKYQPIADELAQKRAVMATVKQAGSKSDPSSLVSILVPKEHQSKVFAEISNAKEAARLEGDIMSTFDQMDKEHTALGAMYPGTPPSVLKYEAMIGSMIRDQDGKPNEAERQTLLNLKPNPFNAPEDVKAKKAALRDFMAGKRQAETAKGFGINIDNFESTSRNPIARMSPQEQQYYQWSKINPQDPKAQMFIQKHGLK